MKSMQILLQGLTALAVIGVVAVLIAITAIGSIPVGKGFALVAALLSLSLISGQAINVFKEI